VTGHSVAHDESILYINAAETWVDIFNMKYQNYPGNLINFITESGQMEFVLFGSASANSAKKN
jgi:hypothetical protein